MNTVKCSRHNETSKDWPFPFPANTCVVTTKFVMSGEQPIIEVLHWEDGGWQFMCNSTEDSIDGLVVCMACLHDKFPWISLFKDLACNHSAYLDGDSWQVEEIE